VVPLFGKLAMKITGSLDPFTGKDRHFCKVAGEVMGNVGRGGSTEEYDGIVEHQLYRQW